MNTVLKDKDIEKINKLSINEKTTLSNGDIIICIKDDYDECDKCYLNRFNKCHYIECDGLKRKYNQSVCFKLIDDD